MIKIAISGQIDSDTKVGYSYPHKFDPARPTPEDEWLLSVTDPRNARDFGAEEIFALWKSEHGNYYAIIFPSKEDPRNGRMMITLHVGNKVFIDGKVVVDTLRNLKILVDKEWPNIEDSSIEVLVKDLEEKLSRDYTTATPESTNTKAFRVYKDEKELIALLQFPNQSEYKPYKRILLVPSSCMEFAAQYVVNYKEIQGQISVSYDISRPLPEGVSVDKYHYNYGDTITIRYLKSGFRTRKKDIIADGRNSKYALFNGTEIILNSSETVGVEFDRAMRFDVFSQKNRRTIPQSNIEGLNCSCKLDPNSQYTIIFTDDIPEYNIRVSSKGYDSVDLILTQADFLNGNVQVYLEPSLNHLTIKLDKDGRTVQGEISIYSDDELYPILREMSNYGKKLYTNKVIEKVPASGGNNGHTGKKGKGKTRDSYDNYENNYYENDYYGGSERHPSLIKRIWKWTKFPLITLCVLYLLYLLYTLSSWETPWPFSTFKSKSAPITVTEIEQEEPTPESNNDRLVLEYMKESDVWERAEITSREPSSEYITLIDYISNMQIDEAINHLYSTQTEVPWNGYWKGGKTSFVDMVNKLKTLDKYDYEIKNAIQDAMRKFATTNKVDLENLSREISVIANKYNSNPTSEDKTPAPKIQTPKSQTPKSQTPKSQTPQKPASTGDSGRPTSEG